MNRLFRALKGRRLSQTYEPLEGGSVAGSEGTGTTSKRHFSWLEYYTFLLQGIAMLWTWNMFLAGGPYFQTRFATSSWLVSHFQSSISTTSTVGSLSTLFILTKLQRNASYPKRVIAALTLNIIVVTLLALSTVLFRQVSAEAYFAFLIVMVLVSSVATALCQNGLFSFVTGFGTSEYTQAIMTGQSVAGVLPCIAQIVSVLSIPPEGPSKEAVGENSKAAFAYFMTATVVSALGLIAFIYLARRHPEHDAMKIIANIDAAEEEDETTYHIERRVVGMVELFAKLKWLAMGVAMTFAITMFFPVFTQEILSVRSEDSPSRLFQPACFIPIAFLIWNTGDLLGRVLTAVPRLKLVQFPRLLFLLSVLRIIFIPMYLLCNIRGQGAVIPSDTFYLLVVQLLFGVSNGFLGSTCMMAAPDHVDVDEREAAGAFMSLWLAGGLSTGSLLSFTAAQI